MKALGLAFLELRRLRGPLRRLVPLILCLIPLLYGGTYLWANWDPYGKTDRIPVAVVNSDRPAVSDPGPAAGPGDRPGGRLVTAGDQLVQQLKASGTFDWHLVDRSTAETGLRSGRFAFTIEIPADFSTRLATASNPQPQQAGLVMELNDANNYIAGVMTETVQSKLEAQIDAATHETYVRTLYGRLSVIRQQLTTASNAAHQLTGATTTAQQGAGALAATGSAAGTGASQVAAGSRQISQAVTQIDTAADALTAAVSRQLPATAAALVTAAQVTAQGTAGVHTATSQAHRATTQALTDVTGLTTAHPELAEDPLLQKLLDHARLADTVAGQADSQADRAAGTGAEALKNAQQLQGRTGALQQQTAAVTTPLHLIDSGSQEVATGAAVLATGLNSSGQAAQAAKSAADQAGAGATQLSQTIDAGLAGLPDLNDQQITQAAQILGTPVQIDRHNLHPAGVYGRGMAPFFFGIALWVFGLFAYLLLRPANRRALAGNAPARRIALAGWLPAAALGSAAALVLYCAVDLALGLHPVHPLATAALLVIAAGSFVTVDHFLRTALGITGDLLSLVLLILQLTACGGLYPVATTPAFFQALHPLLPMTYLIDGLRMTVSGGQTSHLVRDCALLTAYGLLFLTLTTLVTRRQRMWTMGRLHPDITL